MSDRVTHDRKKMKKIMRARRPQKVNRADIPTAAKGRTMSDRRFGNVLRWARDRERAAQDYVRRHASTDSFHYFVTREGARAEVFKAMILVMEAETRKARRKRLA